MGVSREMRNCAVIRLTETWLNDNMPDQTFQTDGQLLFRADRNQMGQITQMMRLREEKLVHQLYCVEQVRRRRI